MEQVYIKDKEGNKVLPITHMDAVRDSQGNSLTSVLGAYEDTVDARLDTQDAEIALLNGSEVIVVADHTAVSDPDSQKIYREQGTTSYTDWMYNGGSWKDIATYEFPGIDDEPTAGSNNLVKSDGINKSISLASSNNEELIHTVEFPFKNYGFWYLSSGVPVKATASNCYYTDPIAFVEGCSLNLFAAFQSSIALVYMVYNSNDELIASQVTTNSGGAVVGYALDAPSNAAYIICCSKTDIEGIHCRITKNGNIDVVKFNKSDVVNNLTSEASASKVSSYAQTLTLSNLFGYRKEAKFINIYGNVVNVTNDGIERYFVSGWIPINDYTKQKMLTGLVSQIAVGVAGLAFYSGTTADSFIGYYQPYEDDGVTRGDRVFDVLVAKAMASNENFASAKYFRFTSKPLDYDNINKRPVIELAEDDSLKWIDHTILKSDGTTYTNSGYNYKTSDYVLLNDVTKNLTIYGAASYAKAGVYAFAFYNLNKELVGTAYKHPDDDASTTMEKLCTISVKELLASAPASTSYFRVCYDTAYGVKLVVDSIRCIATNLNEWDNRWSLLRFNKTICIGDSVTQGFVVDYPTYGVELNNSYPVKLAKLMNSEVTNAGMSGDTPDEWYEGRDRGTVHGSLFDQYFPNETTDYDLAIIEFGYNNGNGNWLQWSDLNVEHSNTWAYDQIIAGIKEKNPKIEIVLMISSNALFFNNHSGLASTIKQLAERHSCSVIDLREDLQIHLDSQKWHGQYDNAGTMTYDMTHFSAKGYTAKSALVYKNLIGFFKD